MPPVRQARDYDRHIDARLIDAKAGSRAGLEAFATYLLGSFEEAFEQDF